MGESDQQRETQEADAEEKGLEDEEKDEGEETEKAIQKRDYIAELWTHSQTATYHLDVLARLVKLQPGSTVVLLFPQRAPWRLGLGPTSSIGRVRSRAAAELAQPRARARAGQAHPARISAI